MTDARIEKLAEEYKRELWGLNPSYSQKAFDLSECKGMCKEDFIAGLRKGLELNAARVEAAWPRNALIALMADKQKNGEFTAFVSACDWLKAQLLENLK